MQRRSISTNARHALQLGSISGTTGAVPHNNRLQRTVMDKVPRHIGQRAAAEPGR